MSAKPPVLELHELRCERRKAGTSFTLQIPEIRATGGELLAITGESGCGKSTLLDTLGLIIRPASARTFNFRRANGDMESLHQPTRESVLASLRRRELGYVLQNGGLLPFLTVLENIKLPRRINGLSNNDTAARDLAARLEISSQLDKLPCHLSGGQRQRAAIARALAHHPRVVLADEPTAAVDEPSAVNIMQLFSSLCHELDVTLFVVTHNPRLLKGLAQRFFRFEIEQQSPNDVLSTCHEFPSL